MNKNVKKFIIVIIILLGVSILSVACYFFFHHQNIKKQTIIEKTEQRFTVLSDGSKVNTSEKLKENKKFDGLNFTNISLTEKAGVTQLTGVITNTSKNEKGDYIAEIILVDRLGTELAKMETYIKKLQPQESTTLNASVIFDYSNAYNMVIKKK